MSIPSEILLVALGASIALISSLTTARINNNADMKRTRLELNHRKAQEDRLRKIRSGEELYQLFSKWSIHVLTSHNMLPLVMKDKIDYNAYLDNQIEVGERNSVDPHKIKLITQTYFPNISSQFLKVGAALDKHNDIIEAHKQAYKNSEPGVDFIDFFQNARIEFEKASDTFKVAIVDEIKALDQNS